MKNRNKQSGVIEWILILALATGLIGGLITQGKIDQSQQTIEKVGPDDGKVDW